ncbi:MAG: hypothetical protein RLY29_580, partial [Actinomycetota bacterium]
MTDLRFVGKNGNEIELTDVEGNSYKVNIDDALRSAVNERRLTAVVEDAP